MAACRMLDLRNSWRLIWIALGCCGLVACSDSILPQHIELTSPDHVEGWVTAGIPDEGQVESREGLLRLGKGQPMTGIRFVGDWDALKLPVTHYRLRYDARRVEGSDFFATATFPVGTLDRCVSLVVGGWGGTLVGISSIDYFDASQNSTRGEKEFENDRWYTIQIEVRPDDIRVWIDDLPMVNVSIVGRHLDLRGGEINTCMPLGFATWHTTGEIRNVVMERLTPDVEGW